jgi:3-dehydroquinate dehydratase I
MRPCTAKPLIVRGLKIGGADPLFCAPLVAVDLEGLVAQARVAQALDADLIEWRADFFLDGTARGFIDSLRLLRSVLPDKPIIFTLRIKSEGGAGEKAQDDRQVSIESVAATGLADVIDIELCNDVHFIESVVRVAHEHRVRVILSFHDFEKTPTNEELLTKVGLMVLRGADIAKIAVMPQNLSDVLRLLDVTLQARSCFPGLPLSTMAMGPRGILSRAAGFLFGSDMAYAVAQDSSAPGQIPIADARALAEGLLKHAGV